MSLPVTHAHTSSTTVGRTDAEAAAPPALDLDAIYRAHSRTVLRWAIRLGGPGIDAEDVVQDVFMVAGRRLATFEGPAKLTTWLFRTTEKVVQTARRKQRLRRWFAGRPDAGAGLLGAGGLGPADALERNRDVTAVYRILDRLPARQRQVMILFELEGLATLEIAELTGAPVGTIRVWLFRARARFLQEHTRLFGDGDGDGGSEQRAPDSAGARTGEESQAK